MIKTFYEDVNKNTIRLLLPNKPNMMVIIDREDYDLVKYYITSCNIDGYITVRINRKIIKIHKLITNTGPDQMIDHKDCDRGNNTKINLRHTTYKMNGQNKTKKLNCASNYYNVSVAKKNWGCSICINKQQIWIGTYKTEEYAASARDLYIIKKVEDHMFKYNFEWTDQEIDLWFELLNLKKNKKFN